MPETPAKSESAASSIEREPAARLLCKAVQGCRPARFLMLSISGGWSLSDEHVRGWTELDCSDTNEYGTVHCLACQQIHLINPATGKVVGDE